MLTGLRMFLWPLAQAAGEPAPETGDGLPVGLLVGSVLIFTGILDIILGVLVIGPRIADENQRRVVLGALTAGAVLMFALGALFATGVIDLG